MINILKAVIEWASKLGKLGKGIAGSESVQHRYKITLITLNLKRGTSKPVLKTWKRVDHFLITSEFQKLLHRFRVRLNVARYSVTLKRGFRISTCFQVYSV